MSYMMRRVRKSVLVLSLIISGISAYPQEFTEPYYHALLHNQNNFAVWIQNFGSTGGGGDRVVDVIERIKVIPGYPKNSWITSSSFSVGMGCIRGYDTLTTFGFVPRPYPEGLIKAESFNPKSRHFSPTARSVLDLTYTSTDTLRLCDPPNTITEGYDSCRYPIGLLYEQRSMAWSSPLVDDFILFQARLTNVSGEILRDAFIKISFSPGGGDYRDSQPYFHSQMFSGYLGVDRVSPACELKNQYSTVYSFHQSGKADEREVVGPANLAATGVAVISAPGNSVATSYNWIGVGDEGSPDTAFWGPYLWGPRRYPERGALRYLGRYNTLPYGNGQRYYVLATPEIDYDQMFAQLDYTPEGWIPPSRFLDSTVRGFKRVSSDMGFGGFGMSPGETVEFIFALVGADSMHTDTTAYDRYFDPQVPSSYYYSLNHDQLIRNVRWASWVYDNPGIDTDGDGYFGEFEICNADPAQDIPGDTLWYQGDGVPDFRANLPPPSPPTRIYTSEGKLVIRWNGYETERAIDQFTRKIDFQGYRVYLGRDQRKESLVFQTQWDKEDYIAYQFYIRSDGEGDWKAVSEPISLDSVTRAYQLTNHPLTYTRVRSVQVGSDNYYFEKEDNNVSDLTDLSGVHLAYPGALPPSIDDTLTWQEDQITREHGKPLPKSHEYEFIIDGILPTVPYYVSVTAFDNGYSPGGMPPQESDRVRSSQLALAQTSVDSVLAQNLDVYVYPNPYRSDDNYIERGFENRDYSLPDQKAHRIHFANLPGKCKISVFSLDGDRIWDYEHNPGTLDANGMHAEWDIISRNRQPVVSGLYYWTVESETRTQIGKLMILR